MRPLIGLNMTLMEMHDPLKARALCHLKYIDAVAGAGGIPVLLPPCADEAAIESVLEKLHGFLLIGGPDYLPSEYGGHPQPEAELMHERRHHFDLMLARTLLDKTRKPVLGICGGHQLMNIARGGALVQDLKSEWRPEERQATTLQHSDDERKGSAQEGNIYRHEVRLEEGSTLAGILNCRKVLTNSYHHQAVLPSRIGRGLKATGWAPDGVIEVLEGQEDLSRFLLGVQWHPERQTDEAAHQAIFRALINACA
ncbi:MAG TPA: gamma-glutamyl-gamma-aminobutyrate hydrolase family protein [Planctomycetota bacterium]|nr:gamma-glutamyl-gamma-aminobutyrate hydrolase family protein [Planctomycetota bacterium]